MTEHEKFSIIKQIARALKKEFKGMSTHSYGYCCHSDYDSEHGYTNEKDFIDATIYKGGLNNQYTKDGWQIGSTVHFMWGLTNFKLEDVLQVMRNVLGEAGRVLAPADESVCIEVEFVTPTQLIVESTVLGSTMTTEFPYRSEAIDKLRELKDTYATNNHSEQGYDWFTLYDDDVDMEDNYAVKPLISAQVKSIRQLHLIQVDKPPQK